MFIKIIFNYRGERTQGECVVRANGPDTSQNWLLQRTLTDTDHTPVTGRKDLEQNEQDSFVCTAGVKRGKFLDNFNVEETTLVYLVTCSFQKTFFFFFFTIIWYFALPFPSNRLEVFA